MRKQVQTINEEPKPRLRVGDVVRRVGPATGKKLFDGGDWVVINIKDDTENGLLYVVKCLSRKKSDGRYRVLGAGGIDSWVNRPDAVRLDVVGFSSNLKDIDNHKTLKKQDDEDLRDMEDTLNKRGN